MDNKNVKGIIALAVVTALSFGVILGSKALSAKNGTAAENQNTAVAEAVMEELDTNGAANIEKAVKTENGYVVTVRTKGYGGDILMDVSFDAEVKHVTKVEVLEQNETEGVGSKIAEEEFLSQFAGAAAPVYLPGMALADTTADSAKDENAKADEEAAGSVAAEALVLNDGTYEAKTSEPDNSGFTEVLNMTVKDGKITEVVWDCVTEDGTKKSVMSENGEYTMTEDGPIWKAQAESLAAALVENQNLAALGMKEDGKTDAVSGVSINIMSFVNLAEKCLKEAAGEAVEEAAEENAEETAVKTEAAAQDGTQVDAVSGATISSTAAVNGINDAYAFLQTVK